MQSHLRYRPSDERRLYVDIVLLATEAYLLRGSLIGRHIACQLLNTLNYMN